MPRSAVATIARRVVAIALVWLFVGLGVRVVVAVPERCPDSSPDVLRQTVSEAVGWFQGNQRDNGQWLYRYDREVDEDLGDYNLVRHAGVMMSMYQAGAQDFAGATATADRGLEYVDANIVQGDGWRAFGPSDELLPVGASALLVAGLAERRLDTGDDQYDELLVDMGNFLVEHVEPRGSVLAYWDPETQQPLPDSYSPFFTGEVYWALARLHGLFPDDGWDEPTRRISHYIATQRDAVEDTFPEISDHWAAYGLSEMTAWPDDGPSALDDGELAFARRQAGIGGIQVRWESQRTDEFPNTLLRGHRALGAGVGTLGETLTGLWRVAAGDERLADLREPLAERTLCVAGMLSDRQVKSSGDHALDDNGNPWPERAHGAWFQGTVTQMDDQQHAMSAVLRAIPIAESASGDDVVDPDDPQSTTEPGSGSEPGSDSPSESDDAPSRSESAPSWWLLVLALIVAINPLRAIAAIPVRRRRGEPSRGADASTAAGAGTSEPVAVVAAGAAVSVAALTVLAWISGPLLDWLSISPPTMRVGAGLVLALAAVYDVFTKPPGREPTLPGWGAALIPVTLPALLRPQAALVAIAIGADRGVSTVVVAALLVALAVVGHAAAGAPDPLDPSTPAGRVRLWLSRLVALVVAVIGIALVVNGIYDV